LRHFTTLLLFLLFVSVVPVSSTQAVHAQQATGAPLLYVSLVPQPQALSWLGFYDTLFPLNITITVYNAWSKTFTGGNLTGLLESPSKIWQMGITYRVPSLDPGKWTTFYLFVRPEEAGVYTVTLNDVYGSISSNGPWQVSGGFLAVQIEPPSTLFQLFTIFPLVVIAVVLIEIVIVFWCRGKMVRIEGRRTEMPAAMMTAFGMSEAGKKMESYLLEEKNNRKFESAVSWLLEILGFWTMKLNSESKGEFFKDGQQEIGSADILAYDPMRQRSLVVDCTVGIAETAGLQRISNLAEKLAPHIGDCDPVLVSYEGSELSKKDAQALGVILLDHASLESIVSLVKSHRFQKARRMLE
jgi:hypothetical protein